MPEHAAHAAHGTSADPADAALVRALREPSAGEGAAAALSADELAEEVGVPVSLLEALAREGLLAPREIDGEPRYSTGDAQALRAGLALLQAGVPLDELLGLARRHDAAMRGIADEAVELFVRFVRDPIHGAAESDEEAGERLVTAFREMLPATGAIVGHHFRRLLVEAAEARLTADQGEESGEPGSEAGSEPGGEPGSEAGSEAGAAAPDAGHVPHLHHEHHEHHAGGGGPAP